MTRTERNFLNAALAASIAEPADLLTAAIESVDFDDLRTRLSAMAESLRHTNPAARSAYIKAVDAYTKAKLDAEWAARA